MNRNIRRSASVSVVLSLLVPAGALAAPAPFFTVPPPMYPSEGVGWGSGDAPVANTGTALMGTGWASDPGSSSVPSDPTSSGGEVLPAVSPAPILPAPAPSREGGTESAPSVPSPVESLDLGGAHALVSSLYTCALKRQPSEQEVQYWVGRSSSLSLSSLYRDFFFSDEYTTRQVSDGAYIDDLYACLLRRSPSASEKAYWTSQLGTAQSRYELLQSFLASNEFQSSVLPSISAKTGMVFSTETDVSPIGPYLGAGAGTSFSTNDRVLMTVFFDWYNQYTGAHVVFSDGASQLTDHPASMQMPPFSYASVAWWEKQMTDMHDAGIDVFLPDYWAFPTPTGAPEDPGSYGALGTMVQAMRAMDAKGLPHPKVGVFYDTSTLHENPFNRKLDLTNPADFEYFYRTIRDFWSMIPPQYRAQMNAKPITIIYTSEPAAAYNQQTFDTLQARFSADFGAAPYLILDTSWQGVSADSYTSWGGASLGPQINGVAQIGPGFNNWAVSGPEGSEGRALVSRQNGDYYKNSWNKAIDSGRRVIILETWNELHEGSDIADSQEYGRFYIDLTKQYADLWRSDGVSNAEISPAGSGGNLESSQTTVTSTPSELASESSGSTWGNGPTAVVATETAVQSTPSPAEADHSTASSSAPLPVQSAPSQTPSPGQSSGTAVLPPPKGSEALNRFYSSLYQCVLGRSPDAVGLAFWEAKPAGTPLKTIYEGFFASDEYQQKKVPDYVFVAQLYQCILNRTPGTSEVPYWVSELTSGSSRSSIVDQFVSSNEFQTGIGVTRSQETGYAR